MTAPRLAEVEGADWDDRLRRIGVADVYYSRGFVASSAILVDASPLLLHLAGEGGDVVFPVLLRSDPTDVVTPYGYGGPLGIGVAPPVGAFAAAYAGWCERRGVVSTFVVHHPLYATQRHAAALGFHSMPLAGTVAWALDREDLLSAMHKHHRRLVRKAETHGFAAEVTPEPGDLAPFTGLYLDAMSRIGASDFYRFPQPYWDALRAEVRLVQVEVRDGSGALAAAVLGAGDPPWLHYHLGAATESARGTGASHLALYTLARWGLEHGYETLHLGGGVSGRDDALLEYKQRFAPAGLVEAKISKVVHDRATYERLANAEGVDWDGFFPAYRAAY